MKDEPNEGMVGDTAKLMMHRLIVRRLRHDPSLVQKAKDAHARQADQFAGWPFVKEWEELLALPAEELAVKLISRDHEMVQLRNSSPFYLAEGINFGGYGERVRLRRAARRIVKFRLKIRSSWRASMVTTSDPNAPSENASPDIDARDRATRRGVEYMEKDLADAGGAYDFDELRHILRGVSPQDIDDRVADGSILEVRGANNQRQFPKMQFNDDGTVILGLRSVYESFPGRSSWALLNFLVNPQDSLGGAKPIDLLRTGGIKEVVAAVHQIGQQGH